MVTGGLSEWVEETSARYNSFSLGEQCGLCHLLGSLLALLLANRLPLALEHKLSDVKLLFLKETVV